jgi:Subtilase family
VRSVEQQGGSQRIRGIARRGAFFLAVAAAVVLVVALSETRSRGPDGADPYRSFSPEGWLAPPALAGSGHGHEVGRGNGNGDKESGDEGNGDSKGNGNGDDGGDGKAGHHGQSSAQDDASDNPSDADASSASVSSAAGSPATVAAAPNGTRPALGAMEAGGSHDIAAEEILVVADRPSLVAHARRLGFGVVEERTLAALDFSLLRLRPPARMPAVHALALLRQSVPGLTADLNTLYQPYQAQGLRSVSEVISLPSRDYGRRMIGWPETPSCGAGVRIGMIDTDAEADVPALAGQRLHRRSFVVGASGENGHGTAIASLLIGRGKGAQARWNGLLPDADLYLANVFSREDGFIEASAASLAVALDWMAANHVPVVNISVSGKANSLLALAVRRASERGTVLVAAAGNGGPSAPPAYPAAYPQVIAVTAVDPAGNVFEGANRGDYIAFAAPGVRIWIPGRNVYGRFETGTSFAAPYVAAAAALSVKDSGPGAAEGVLRELAAHSRHLGPPGKNPIYGYGLPKVAPRCATPTAAVP